MWLMLLVLLFLFFVAFVVSVLYDDNDLDMINIIRISLENSKPEKENIKIITQNDALNYLITKMKIIKKYSETDKDNKQQEKKMHLMQQLKSIRNIKGKKQPTLLI